MQREIGFPSGLGSDNSGEFHFTPHIFLTSAERLISLKMGSWLFSVGVPLITFLVELAVVPELAVESYWLRPLHNLLHFLGH